VRRTRFGGLRRLQSRKSSGRAPKRTPQPQRTVLGYLIRGALRAGFPTDRWPLRRIQAVIKREFTIAYHPNSLSRFLRKLGWTPQPPVPRAADNGFARLRHRPDLIISFIHHAGLSVKQLW
jgi:transposase